jgi:cell division protein FtsN
MKRRIKHTAAALQTKRTQRGGTILGVIVGLLLGLAAALAVAIYVTKVPVPFVNKGSARGVDQDAAETKKNKDWDPNAPLYGKNPAKPVPVVTSPSVTGTVTPPASSASSPKVDKATAKTEVKAENKTDAKTEPKSETKTTTKADPKPSADPLGDLAKAKSAGAPAVSSAGGADPFVYFVQVGAYRTPEDAEAQRAKLSLMGLDAKITEREQSGRTVFRVRAGPFDKKDEADKTKEKLDGGGIDTALVRVQR